MKARSVRSMLLLSAVLGVTACSDSPTAPAEPETVPRFFGDEDPPPGPGEPCYPHLHGPTCVPDEHSYTGYVIAN